MKNLKYFALVGLAATALTASAQFANSGRVGASASSTDIKNYSRLYVDFADMFCTSESYLGFKAGYSYGFNIVNTIPLYLEVGGNLQFNTKSEFGVRANFLAINAPVTINYKQTFPNGFFIQPYAGLNLKVNVLSKMSTGSSYYDTDDYYYYYDTDDYYYDTDEYYGGSYDLDVNRVQFGGTFGTRIGYKNFDVNIGYDVLSNIAPYTAGNCFHVGVGFVF